MCKCLVLWPAVEEPCLRGSTLRLGAAGFLLGFKLFAQTAPAAFTPLHQLPPPKIVASAAAYPGQYAAGNLLDADPRTEYASNGKGTNTFVEVEFSEPTALSGFRHVDRNDPATVAESELVFLDASSNVVSRLPIKNVNERGGVTFTAFPKPVVSKRVRWQVTALGSGLGTVGGSELAFFTAGLAEPRPANLTVSVRALQLRERAGDKEVQPLKIRLNYPYIEAAPASLQVEGLPARPIQLIPGEQLLEVAVPAVDVAQDLHIGVEVGGQQVLAQIVRLNPVRPWRIFLLPHSHVDIGYTALQSDVEKKQNSNIETGLRLARETADYPPGSQFKWNVEVLWPVDNYLRDCTPEQREAFISAVRAGQIGLDAFYGNTLTGLCRPEELLNLMGYAMRLSEACGVPIESAMISDVPGYTWSTVSAMAQAGVKYFSFAPNYFDRMGATMKEWQNRPFWWEGPDGRSRVLAWCPSRGYALGHLIGEGAALTRFLPDYLAELETNAYPYDITYLRWNVHGDNGSPDEHLSEVVKDWNSRYVYPHLVISTTSAAFRQFEHAYGNQLPVFKGDYTPYWEDGAASSARETALNRASDERLVQAETLWAMRNPGPFPSPEFQNAWRDALLYSEHTWGAHNSISQPDLDFVRDQWKVKQGFALQADQLSRELLRRAAVPGSAPEVPGAIDVFNTSSWPRTDLVTVPASDSTAGDKVLDERGAPVASQRLSTGELAFLASRVPPFGASRFRIVSGACPVGGGAKAEPSRLICSNFFVRVDENSGAIKYLYSRSVGRDFVATNGPTELNDYFYLPGADLKGVQRSGKPSITIKENGPLVASLLIESDAPGCKKLTREVRVIDGLDRVELINTVDKLAVRAKEGVHFGYGFDVPRGTVRLDVGWGAVRPEVDQIPAACKNWFSVQRWVDISNDRYGITWSSVDAPLVELGGMTANLIGSQTDDRVWIQHLPASQTIYSWVMNNHWHTNYRADQDGPTVFRYALQPHRAFAADESARFGVSCSQPLIALKASGKAPPESRLRLSTDRVLVSAFKPADDGKGWIVRLFGASGHDERVKLSWNDPAPRHLWLSDLSEQPKHEADHSINVPAWGIVTLRAE
ncbi:MAG TPA: glycosyl hydrolase-related protein [Verrucomicrobiae bacterium]|nr:glycosyl hydrolase-related protein [Verrucomicrobiae bacterium]